MNDSLKIEIVKLNHDDINRFTELIRVFEDVFEMENFSMPAKSYLQELLKRDDFFSFIALADSRIVGGLTSYILHQYYSQWPLVYIFDLAVKAGFQRKGIGRMLIEGNNDFCRSIGAEAVMVQADEADDHAVDFYRSTGAKGEKVVHFDYWIK